MGAAVQIKCTHVTVIVRIQGRQTHPGETVQECVAAMRSGLRHWRKVKICEHEQSDSMGTNGARKYDWWMSEIFKIWVIP